MSMPSTASKGDAARSFVDQVKSLVIRWLVRDSRLGRARGVLRVWPVWERVARRVWPVVDVPGSPRGLLGIHFTTYRGPPFTLPDGAMVRPGDPVAEMHADNRVMVEALGAARGSEKWYIIVLLRDELRAIAAWMNRPDFPAPIVAIHGVSIVARGAVRLGFTLRPRERSVGSQLDRLFFAGLLILYASEGMDRLSLGLGAGPPTQVWISREELLRRYGEGSSESR